MTPKEKASNLFECYKNKIDESDFHIPEFISGVSMDDSEYESVLLEYSNDLAKQCALIAVDEICLAIPDASDDDSPYNHELIFWQKVKQEIEKL